MTGRWAQRWWASSSLVIGFPPEAERVVSLTYRKLVSKPAARVRNAHTLLLGGWLLKHTGLIKSGYQWMSFRSAGVNSFYHAEAGWSAETDIFLLPLGIKSQILFSSSALLAKELWTDFQGTKYVKTNQLQPVDTDNCRGKWVNNNRLKRKRIKRQKIFGLQRLTGTKYDNFSMPSLSLTYSKSRLNDHLVLPINAYIPSPSTVYWLVGLFPTGAS